MNVALTMSGQPTLVYGSTFSYDPPVINSLVPNIGGTGGGYLLTISGSSLDQYNPATTRVTVGSNNCTFNGVTTVYSHSQIVPRS